MDFAYFLSQTAQLFVGDGAYFVLYAIATCLLTQLVKKIFVSKAKVDVLHKFDWAKVIPFIFSTAFAVLDVFCIRAVRPVDVAAIMQLVTSALAIGALASTFFKFVKAIFGQSLASLMKNDLFGVFYTQLLYFGNVREQIADKRLSFDDFIDQVKLLVADAEAIYKQDDSVDAKRCRLAKLLSGIIDEKSIETCVNVINEALTKLFASK